MALLAASWVSVGCSEAAITLDGGVVDAGGVDAGGGVDGGGGDAGDGSDAGDGVDGGRDAGGLDGGADGGVDGGPPPDGGPEVMPGTGDLVITEMMIDSDAAGDALGEWFELHNPSTTQTMVVDGCEFYDNSRTTETIGSFSIPPGAYVTFAISATPGGFTPDYVYSSGMRLSNDPGGDSLTFECDGTVIDAVAYLDTWPWDRGQALSLDPGRTAAENDMESSWCGAVDVYNMAGGDFDYGTPGTVNPDCP